MTPIFDFSLTYSIHTKQHRFGLQVACCSHVKRLAMIGASGAGKSLTLRLLAGLANAQSGYIHIAGQTYYDSSQKISVPPQQRKVGLMFQDYALFPHLTVAQNIAFGLQQGFRQPEKRPNELTQFWLEKMQLHSVAYLYPYQLSGGQKQRTALARTCITQPKWLLLDEPFSALNAALREEMREWVGILQQELNIPLLLVSHDSRDTERLADEVWTMQQGQLLAPHTAV